MQWTPRLLLTERLTLAVLLCGVASLALSDFVSPFYWLLVVVAAAVRLQFGPRFSLRELYASLIGWAGFLWVGIELALGRAPVVAFTDFLLILSLAIVIEEATPRNHLHRMLVGFALILGAAVLTDSVLYVFPLAGFLWFVWRASHCLYGMQLPGGDLPVARWQGDLNLMLLMAVMTGLLFFILPRFDFQSYLKPVQPRMQTSGFSNSVQLGDFARTLDATVVMRAEPLGEDVEAFRRQIMGRYWRGTTLSIYTGHGWQAMHERDLERWHKGESVVLAESRKPLRFAVYREASDHPYIFVPDGLTGIENIPESIVLGNQGALRFDTAPSRRLRLVMELEGRSNRIEGLRPPRRSEFEKRGLPAELVQWAADIAGSGDAKSRLDRLMGELKSWQYDLNSPIDAAHPVASFLRLKRGHCELYATTLALAARSLGIPARIVNGYSGGEWNSTGGFFLIRQQHAHSWVEVWQDSGWQRLDPTPASRWQLTGVNFPTLDEIWESVKLSWYRYVLEFQNSDRSETIRAILAMMKAYAVWFIGGGILLLTAIALERSGIRLPRLTTGRGQLAQLDRWLSARNVHRQKHQTIRKLTVPQGIGEEKWRQFVRDWELQAYGKETPWSRRQLKRHLSAL